MFEFFAALCCLVVLAGVGFGVYKIIQKKRSEQERRQPSSAPRDPFADHDADALRGNPVALKAGDIFDTHGETLTVRGTLRLREGGVVWDEHLIDTGGGVKRWLSVEQDPDLELMLWTEVEGAPEPGPRTLEFQGTTWRLEEEGRAQYRSEASTGLAPSGSVHYFDYESSDGTGLAFEDFKGNGRFEAAIGVEIHRNEITIYPQQPS